MNNDLSSVLIIDDERTEIKILSHILGDEYNIYTEKHGKDARATAIKVMPDIILLDIVMPEMDGYEVMRELKSSKITKDIPVIFISGLDSIAAEKKGLEMGAVDYISKPFSPEVVKLRVANQMKILKQTKQILEWERAEIQIANKAKSAFLASMNHEIRTPMNAIIGNTELLMLNENMPDDIAEGLGRINNSCELLAGIISNILDFSKIEAGKLDIINKQYSVAGLIKDTVNLNTMRKENKLIEFDIQIDEKTPARLIGDELRLKQIMGNLLSNAFKYTQGGKVMLSISRQEGRTEDEMTLVICVRDTGQGMTEEQLSKLFEEYTRFNQEENTTIEGTGLGLTITKSLIDMLEGSIDVKSEYGKGSMFTARIPQKLVDDEVLGKEFKNRFNENYKEEKKPALIRDPMPYGNVLIVDDLESNLYIEIGLLKPYLIRIDSANNGYKAIRKIKEGNVYDIIFMDHMMPGIDGLETTKQIREEGYKEPIVALTANAVSGMEDLFLKSGFDAFMSKPIDVRKLDALLNKFVRDKQPGDVVEAARQKFSNRGKQPGTADSTPPVGDAPPHIPQSNADSTPPVGDAPPRVPLEAETSQPPLNKTVFAQTTIEGLDLQKGLEEFGFDKDAYLRVLRSYAATNRPLLEIMAKVSEENFRDYLIYLHNIKGSSYSIFADAIGKTAKEIEAKAKEYDLAYVNEHNPALLASVKKLIENIDKLLKAYDEENPKPEKDFPDKELLADIIKACDDYSIDEVNKAMKKIEAYKYTTDKEFVPWLREKVDMMQFPEIIEKLTELVGN